MIAGFLRAGREAVIVLTVHGPAGQELRVEAIVDTGFTDLLTLPRQLIVDLALPFAAVMPVALADGSRLDLDVFDGTVFWDGQERPVAVLAAEGDVLVGMAMLLGYRLTLEVEHGGSVLIEALP